MRSHRRNVAHAASSMESRLEVIGIGRGLRPPPSSSEETRQVLAFDMSAQLRELLRAVQHRFTDRAVKFSGEISRQRRLNTGESTLHPVGDLLNSRVDQ